ARTDACEVAHRAEALVSVLVPGDRPWAADVALGRLHAIVAPLAERAADRMDGREVEDVEAHAGDARELGLDVGEGAGGAREELVPGAERGLASIDFDCVLAAEARDEAALAVAPHQIEELVAAGGVDFVGDVVAPLDDADVVFE